MTPPPATGRVRYGQVGPLALVGALLVLGACGRSGPGAGTGPLAGPPALVVILVVDQLRPDRATRALPGGLGRLLREGRVYEQAWLEHAGTETCPGHAALATGRHPGPAGIPANVFFMEGRSEGIYCVADESPAGRLLVESAETGPDGRSPRYLRAEALGDWLRAQRPGARVFSVSGKDRAAIALGGRRPDAAFWLDRRASGHFTSSRYYLARLPEWAERWNAAERWRSLPEVWTHATGDPPNGTRADDFPGEARRFSRTSPHPLRVGEDLAETFARLQVSPELDAFTLSFASDLVREEGLGRDGQPDLLGVSLSATDYVGHYYGPYSQESRDTLERLDHHLDVFLRLLEERTAGRGLLVVLTADHGVMPLPEWLSEAPEPESRCPVPGGRIDTRTLDAWLQAQLSERFGGVGVTDRPWFGREDHTLAFDADRLAALGLDRARVVAAARELLAASPGVERVWSREEIAAGAGPEPFARLYHNSWAEGRDGDLVVQPQAGCLLSPYPEGTGHGSPRAYDRHIPLVFFGRGVEPGRVSEAVALVDVAPTVAHVLGLVAPEDLDGRPLSLGSTPR